MKDISLKLIYDRSYSGYASERRDLGLQRFIDDGVLGQILTETSAVSREVESEMAHRYLHDFVHMVYNPLSSDDLSVSLISTLYTCLHLSQIMLT